LDISMRGKGIVYDTGFLYGGGSSREHFDPSIVARELQIIRDDLHCNAVRVTGGDPTRLQTAAELAAAAGLEVWFSPFTGDQTPDELLKLLRDCAERAERLRQQGAAVVFVTGGEIALMTKGFLPGDTLPERLALLESPQQLRAAIPQVPSRINAFLSTAIAEVRSRFGGKLTYASVGHLERVEWTSFDFVSLDSYRSAEVADRYREGIRALVSEWRQRGKPVAITEFGCTTHRGAADKGARGSNIVQWDGATPVRLDGEYVRDEAEQAVYLRELVNLFDAEGVDSAFAFTFASYQLPHRAGPREDLDMASYGVVKVFADRGAEAYPDMPWEPKQGFYALADAYRG
jgi:hypothetical protein